MGWSPGDIPRARLIRWAVTVVVLVVGLVVLVQGANRPANPVLEQATRAPVSGFGEISYRVASAAPGGAAWRCALLAESVQQQERGLMGRTDLAGHDGMLFRFPKDTTTSFFMKDTRIPLSIAWFDSGGKFVSSTDMPPCGDLPVCPTYSATAPYRYALEVRQGALPGLGVHPSARIDLREGCS